MAVAGILLYSYVPIFKETLFPDECGMKWNRMQSSCNDVDDCTVPFDDIGIDYSGFELRCEDNFCEIKTLNCGWVE